MSEALALTQLESELQNNNWDYASNRHNSSVLAEFNLCTFAEHNSSAMVVFPTSVEDIQWFINTINTLNKTSDTLKIYTVSSGQNWGYGSATPTSEQAILLCLKHLNPAPEWVSNTLDTDMPYGKKLGILKLSAGVTQQQLYDFLQQQGGDFWMDATGSSPSCSVLANTLERGFGHTSYGDHFEHVAGMEVVLADGSLVKTGHAGCKNAANIGVHKQGLGPYLDGLFSQSNLGIVTAIYLRVMPAKKHLYTFFIKLKSDQDFAQAVEQLQVLKLNGTLNSQMHCANAHKGIQAMMRYPYKETDGITPLSDDIAENIIKANGISPWTISGAIYGNSWLDAYASRRALVKALKDIPCKKIILSDGMATSVKNIISSLFIGLLLPKLQQKMLPQLNVLSALIDLKKGIPSDFFIKSVYWRKKALGRSLTQPDKDRVGLIWLAPIGPMTKESIEYFSSTTKASFKKYGFEPSISMTLLNERAVDCVISIIFDRDSAQDEIKALQCHDELLAAFNKMGFSVYRSSTRAMSEDSLNFSDELTTLQQAIKKGVDPQGLLSPGHYIKP
ncbi:MAG: hypothetical protein COA90_08980 [Gammaproteobacteria bacterium]|nr:MAG: hypothetical protein COA90_08980 [Gammaproteobacteria bacterium]